MNDITNQHLLGAMRRLIPRLEIDPTTKCWNWTGARTDGYGRIGAGMKVVLVHRLTYTMLVGPIPPELPYLDHLCRNTACCNPDHLEPVTPLGNTRSGQSPGMLTHRSGRCRRGHERLLYGRLTRRGTYRCRECDRMRAHARKQDAL